MLTDEGPNSGPSAWQLLSQRIAADVADSQKEWRNSLLERVDRPLTDVLLKAADSAAVFAEGLETIRTGESISQAEIWTLLATYRASMETEVISAVTRHLRDEKPADGTARLYQEFLSRLVACVEAVPDRIESFESGSVLLSMSNDGFWLRMRKAIARKSGDSKPEGPFARRLAAYHVRVRLPRRFTSGQQKVNVILGKRLLLVETAFSNWTHASLDAEHLLDLSDESLQKPEAVAGDTGGDSTVFESAFSALEKTAHQLERALREAAETNFSDVPHLTSDQLDAAHRLLSYDIAAAGTFLLRDRDRNLPSDEFIPAELARMESSEWIVWADQARNRMRLNQHLLRTRQTLIDLLLSLLENVMRGTVAPLRAMYAGMETAIVSAGESFTALIDSDRSSTGSADLIEKLRDGAEVASRGIERQGTELDGLNSIDRALRNLGEKEWEKSMRDVEQLPGKLEIHAIDLPDSASITHDVSVSSVDLRRIVTDTLAIRYGDLLKKPALELRRRVLREWGETVRIGDVIAFGVVAAVNEIESSHDDQPYSERLSVARGFITEGSERAVERVRVGSAALDEPWDAFSDAAVRVLTSSWEHVHRRARSAELDTEQWAGMGSRFSVGLHSFWLERLRDWTRFEREAAKWFRFLRFQARILIRRGQSAVGVADVTTTDGTATIDTLNLLGEMSADLPPIYRRLFALTSLIDGAFLENRSTDLAIVKNHFQRWRDGIRSSTLILSAPLGGGRASFLNTLKSTVFEEADVRSVVFETRPQSSDEVAAWIAHDMGVQIDGHVSFETLKQVLISNIRDERPLVCCLYSLEHLVINAPDGTQIIKDLLIFLSRTDHRVYWIGGMGDLCHQFLQRTSTTTGFVRFHRLTPFNRKTLESVIMSRHRRSGFDLRFMPAPKMTTLMKQRLRSVKTEDGRQAIIRDAFFERLYRFAGQNLRLALFYWIKSLRRDDNPDGMIVDWPEALNFNFLGDLDLSRAFSLRSFLFHHSLTVAEHRLIYRLTDDESIVIMESLLNSGLIVPMHDDDSEGLERRIDLGHRYRVHPLMLGPITRHLVGRRIIY